MESNMGLCRQSETENWVYYYTTVVTYLNWMNESLTGRDEIDCISYTYYIGTIYIEDNDWK